MKMFNKQSKFNESIYEILEDAFENESNEKIVGDIISNTNISDYIKIIEIFVAQKKYDEARINKIKQDNNQKNSNEDSFEKSVEPAIRYLFKNHNPHTKIYINYNIAELVQGQICHDLTNEVPD